MLILLMVSAQFCIGASDLTTIDKRLVITLRRQRVPVKSDSRTISYKSAYFGTIWLGAPTQQEFSVVFDTGSGHIIIPSTDCHSRTCRIHRQYDRKHSELAIDVDYDGALVDPGQPRDQITVSFGTGEVTGEFVQDTICLEQKVMTEPGPHDRITEDIQRREENYPELADQDCVKLRVVLATEMTQEPFQSFAFDGVLGLGLGGLALAPEFSYFGRMVSEGRIGQPRFGVFLADSDEEESEISFGGISPDHVDGELTWAPVALPDLGYWQVRIKEIWIGNRLIDFCSGDADCRAVVDTGTSLLAVPSIVVEELQSSLTKDLVQDVEKIERDGCKGIEGSPLHFVLEDNFTITMMPEDYSRQSTIHNKNATGADEAPPQVICRPTMMPLALPAPLGPKLFIWGEPVLRKYYTVYDWEAKQIGFGKAVHLADLDSVSDNGASHFV